MSNNIFTYQLVIIIPNNAYTPTITNYTPTITPTITNYTLIHLL